ncbi:MAG TPA: FAD-dependent oxidoreductase [Frankiaceae bacterium]|nr:FAD-dependent oxidoreductase [Frankiaceae bacterium]
MATNEHVVIVGGGLAGWRAAEELRAAGFGGRLTLLSDEVHPPYDRPPLSKRLLKADVEPSPIHLAREGSDETTLDLDLRRGVRAVGLRPGVVLTEDASGDPGEVTYDALVIATGVRARELPALSGHPRVHLLRTFDDVLALRHSLDTAQSLLVVGAGFIGAEVATAAHDRGVAVTVIEALEVPYQRTLGELLGGIVGRMARRYGVALHTGTGVDELIDSAESVHVRLSNGTSIEADIAVVGVGTQVNVEWLQHPATPGAGGWETGVTCDGAGRALGLDASFGRVYALGDVAAWHDASHDRHLRFEHWTTAVDQAPVLARALVRDLAGEPAEPAEPLLPYFWSDQFGRKVQLLGRPGLADSVELLHGEEPADPDEPAPRKLLAGYFAGDRLVAIAGISAPALLGRYRALLNEGASRGKVLAFAAETG